MEVKKTCKYVYCVQYYQLCDYICIILQSGDDYDDVDDDDDDDRHHNNNSNHSPSSS
jgi:hypothetical protein